MGELILGLNTDHGDSSAALLGPDGAIAAIAEERINRRKHCADFPSNAIREVLKIAGADGREIGDIAVARNPRANVVAKLRYMVAHPRSGFRMAGARLAVHSEVSRTPERVADALGIPRADLRATLHQVEHHLAHVASAFYWSPFDRCCGFSNDGAGDFATTMWTECRGSDIEVIRRSHWPHSLGVFYTGLCQFIGFDRYGEEYKVMGLSAYGCDRFRSLMEEMVSFSDEGGLRLNLKYFQHQFSASTFETMVDGEIVLPQLWADALSDRLGPPRRRTEMLGDRERDLAASMQIQYENIFLKMVRQLVQRTESRQIVLAGGCALNSVANGRMISEGYVDQAYFQPAAGDDGTALGAALYVKHAIKRHPRTGEVKHAFWGPEYRDEETLEALRRNGRQFRRVERGEMLAVVATALAGGKIVGWFHGREEWGPRALGNRSILCNPALPDMKATLNARIKNREPFRPFAPVVREEDLSTVFEGSHPVPFMIIVYKVRSEWQPRLPAITHEDGTGRVQTVTHDQNPLYYDLLSEFKRRTGVPVLLNTSFNENEPIVHTPSEAIDCFERTRMDALSIGGYWLEKAAEGERV